MNRWPCRDCCSRPRVTAAVAGLSRSVKTRNPVAWRGLWPWLASLLLWALASLAQAGVMDRVLHPVEPLTFRVTVAGTF